MPKNILLTLLSHYERVKDGNYMPFFRQNGAGFDKLFSRGNRKKVENLKLEIVLAQKPLKDAEIF